MPLHLRGGEGGRGGGANEGKVEAEEEDMTIYYSTFRQVTLYLMLGASFYYKIYRNI